MAESSPSQRSYFRFCIRNFDAVGWAEEEAGALNNTGIRVDNISSAIAGNKPMPKPMARVIEAKTVRQGNSIPCEKLGMANAVKPTDMAAFWR